MQRQATGWNRGRSARPTAPHIGSFYPLQATVSPFRKEGKKERYSCKRMRQLYQRFSVTHLPYLLRIWGSRSPTILIERLPNLEGTRLDIVGTRRVICSLAEEGCLSFSCVSYKYEYFCVCALASCFLLFFPFFTFSSFSLLVPNPFLCVICRWVSFWEAKLDL